jgi:hypothetical protein
MAQSESTTSLGFRTRVAGHVALQQTVKHNAEKADEVIVALTARVHALENQLFNLVQQFDNSNSAAVNVADSNSPFGTDI